MFAVIFTSKRTSADEVGYQQMATCMDELARQQPGFVSVESVRGDDGVGITISYWESLDAIASWRDVEQHRLAQKLGKDQWYEWFRVRVCRVEYERAFFATEESTP